MKKNYFPAILFASLLIGCDNKTKDDVSEDQRIDNYVGNEKENGITVQTNAQSFSSEDYAKVVQYDNITIDSTKILNLFAFRVKDRLTPIREKGRDITSCDIYYDFVKCKNMILFVPDENDALELFTSAFATDNGFTDFYQLVKEEAIGISTTPMCNTTKETGTRHRKGPVTPCGWDPWEPLNVLDPEITAKFYKANPQLISK